MYAKFSGRFVRCIGYCGAVLFIGASAAQNIGHGYSLGLARSETAALIFAAGSLAGAIMGPVSFLAAWNAFRNWRIGGGAVALVLGCCCVIYASLSSLGFIGTAHDTSAAVRGAEADAYAVARDKAKAANAELKTLAEQPRADRKTEAKRAERRTKLEKDRADAERVLAAGASATMADPTAAAIASYAGALGWKVESEELNPFLTLLAVLFFEVGSACSLIVVAALNVPISENSNKAAPAEKKTGRNRSRALDDVADRIRSLGGRLEGSIEDIGRRLGLSKSSAHRALHALAGAGVIGLATSAAGTLVQLRA